MKRVWLLWLFVWLIVPVQAQSLFELAETASGKLIYLPRRQAFEFKWQIPEVVYQSYTPSSTLEMDRLLRAYMPDFVSTSVAERPMDMQILSAAYRPFYDEYAPMMRSVSPMAFDFQETSLVPLNAQTAFFTTGRQFTWPGAGGITDIRSGLIWQQDRWTLSGSAFAGRYFTPFNVSPDFVAGAGMDVRYQVNDWLGVRGWGQYTHYDKHERYNPHMLLNPSYNHTGAGGAIELYLNEDFGVGMGVNYEFNPWKRKMEPQYLVYPIFRRR